MKRICAWCLRDMGEIAPEQPGVTHGICDKCKTKILAENKGQLDTADGGRISNPPLTAPRPFLRTE